jgi:hypothetical protein
MHVTLDQLLELFEQAGMPVEQISVIGAGYPSLAAASPRNASVRKRDPHERAGPLVDQASLFASLAEADGGR